MKADLREFLGAVAKPAGDDAHVWIAHFQEPPSSAAAWRGYHCAPADAPRLNGSENCFFSIAAFDAAAPARKADHAIGVTCIVADDVGTKAKLEDVRSRLGEPSWRIETSPCNEQWGYLLDKVYPPSDVVPVYAQMAEHGLSDKSGHGPVRYVRLPCGHNNKPELDKPFTVRRIDWHPDRRFSLDQLKEALAGGTSKSRKATKEAMKGDGKDAAELIRMIVAGESYHDALRDFAAKRAARGESEASIVETLRGAMLAAPDHDERWQARLDDLPRLVSSAVEKFSPPKRDARIILRTGQRERALDEFRIALALQAEEYSVFIFAGGLARPYLTDAPGFRGSRVPVLEINRLTPRALAENLGRMVEVRRIKIVKGGAAQEVASDIPIEYAQFLIDSPDRWGGIPVIDRFVEAPLFIDGELLARSGYHPAARAWVQAPEGVKLPRDLSKKGAAAALARINALLDEFPFAGPTDRATALAMLFCSAMRGSLPAAPGFAIDKPEYGAGASTATRVAHVIHAGRMPAVITLSRGDPEELRKAVDAAQLAGRSAIVIDNATSITEADALAQVLTEPERLVRVLGVSQVVRVPCTQLVIVNGVNLRIGDDMVRRLLPIRLEPRTERPDQRQFKRPALAEEVIRDRAQILSDIYSVIAAYRASGRRVKPQTLVGYAEFIETCVEPLVWLGQPDPLAGMARLRVEDPAKAALREVVDLWRRAWGSRPVETRDVVREGHEHPAPASGRAVDTDAARELGEKFAEIVGTERGGSRADTKRTGEWLMRQRGRVVDGMTIERDTGGAHRKVAVWVLRGVAGTAGRCGDVLTPTRRENPGDKIFSPADGGRTSPHVPAVPAGSHEGQARHAPWDGGDCP